MKLLKTIVILLLITSCGKTKQEEIETVLTSVENFLTNGNCEKASSKLSTIDAQNKNARYIKLKASVAACFANYDSATFITEVATNLDATNLLSSLTLLTTSQSFDGAGNEAYDYIQSAINTLAYAGGLSTSENPTHALRRAEFTAKEATEISSFLLFLTMTQLGKYAYYYGDTSANGVKGGGGNHNCFFDYDANMDGTLDAVLGGAGGNCIDTGETGHPDLDAGGGNIDVPLACEAVVLTNMFINTLTNVGGDSLSSELTNVVSNITTLFGAIGFTDSTITSVTSQTKCETDFAANSNDLERYFGFVLELLHNKQ